MTDAHGVARDQLRAFIERIERLEEEKKTIADDIKDVYGEAKGMGYDTKIMKQVIALRKKDDQERTEEDMVRDTYLAALGMLPDFEADIAPAPGAPKPTRSPAMALQSPRKAAEAVSERTAVQVEDHSPAEATIEGQPSETVATSAESAGEAASKSSDLPTTSKSEQPLEGGDDEVAQPQYAATQQAGSPFSTSRPADHPILLLRPHCRHPGEEVCGGSGKNHCQNCLEVMRELETA